MASDDLVWPPHEYDLPGYDPEGLLAEIPVRVSNGGIVVPGYVNRERQIAELVLPLHRLFRLLGIPREYTVERVSLSETPHEPALHLVVEGVGMPVHAPGSPVYLQDFETTMNSLEQREQEALRHWVRVAISKVREETNGER